MSYYYNKRVTENVYILSEIISKFQVHTMGLIVGKDQVAVIDAGMGLSGKLPEYIKEITDKPQVLLLTHGHMDHIGGAPLFSQAYLSPLDFPAIPFALDYQSKLDYIKALAPNDDELYGYALKNMCKIQTLKPKSLYEGDTFQLGGDTLEAVTLGGHSPGSMGFYNKEKGYFFTGDSINTYVWNWLDRASSITEYRESLIRVRETLPDDTILICSHNQNLQPVSLIDNLITNCTEIINGENEKDLKFRSPVPNTMQPELQPYRHRYKNTFLVYNKSKI